MTMLQTKAQVLAGLLVSNEGLPQSAATPGPIITALEALLAQLLPMLLACIPALSPSPAVVLAAASTLDRVQMFIMRDKIFKNPAFAGDVALGEAVARQIPVMIQGSSASDFASAMAGE